MTEYEQWRQRSVEGTCTGCMHTGRVFSYQQGGVERHEKCFFCSRLPDWMTRDRTTQTVAHLLNIFMEGMHKEKKPRQPRKPKGPQGYLVTPRRRG